MFKRYIIYTFFKYPNLLLPFMTTSAKPLKMMTFPATFGKRGNTTVIIVPKIVSDMLAPEKDEVFEIRARRLTEDD